MAENIVAHLGKKWEIMNAGFKPYPVCAFNQTPVTNMLAMVRENKINADEVERIQIRVNPYEYNYAGMTSRGPFNSVGATLMSTPYCLAAAVVEKEITLKGISQFTHPKILALIDRIDHIPDEKIPRWSCIIETQMKDGKKLKKDMIISAEYYNFNMDRDIELIKQVTSETGVNQSKVERLVSLVKDLPNAQNVRPLVEVLAGCP
jgi:2-methylcitrate dehydratase PrpD